MERIKYTNTTNKFAKNLYTAQRELLSDICFFFERPDVIEAVADLFLGQSPADKKIRHPNKPKKPMSTFLLFCEQKRSELKPTDLALFSKNMGAQWAVLPDMDKQVYVDKYRNLCVTFKKDMEHFTATQYENITISQMDLGNL
jgi:hypothetical protein